MRAGRIEALRRIAKESVHPGEREAARRALDREADKVHENVKSRTSQHERNEHLYSEELFEEVLHRMWADGFIKPPETKFSGASASFIVDCFATKVRAWMSYNLNKCLIHHYDAALVAAVADISSTIRGGATFTARQIRQAIVNFTFGDAKLGQEELVNQAAA